MKKSAQYFLAGFVLIALVWLTACERNLSGTEKEVVLAFSEPITDNLFTGLADNDYEVFSVDFDGDIEENMPATTFAAMKEDLDSKLGHVPFPQR